ncbi:hypothetical protein IscW_ISCW003741 [Ixodes scapularis]|uniref:Uncharacterized protein n=1 Tax=Ixodes scapularis TaxID=6945 RepID=B7PFN9_IXOSC|nr:hypothetical protein IscW_ISCW003741 [Ixodes scapularis]|eukprot:XP_002434011.1 hypothetical protein IscW_ISCW003741 [Ixodes scapularis]
MVSRASWKGRRPEAAHGLGLVLGVAEIREKLVDVKPPRKAEGNVREAVLPVVGVRVHAGIRRRLGRRA